ncbi:MAG: hypothetical protein ACI9K2_007142 [Myxococcota bacterium]|jgi:hypothetical protein
MDVAQIRERVDKAKAGRAGGEAYPPDVRDVVARHATEQRKRGRTWASIQLEVGISSTAMRSWMRERPVQGFQQLQVVDDDAEPGSGTGAVLTSPNGFTVSGCTIEDIARLLVVVG